MSGSSPRKIKNAINLELHQSADEEVRKQVNEFAINLIVEGKRIAFRNQADLVMRNHVIEALNSIVSKSSVSTLKQVAQIVGGALFGAFLQGFITELYNNNSVLVVVYVAMGFSGVALFMWGLWKDK